MPLCSHSQEDGVAWCFLSGLRVLREPWYELVWMVKKGNEWKEWPLCGHISVLVKAFVYVVSVYAYTYRLYIKYRLERHIHMTHRCIDPTLPLDLWTTSGPFCHWMWFQIQIAWLGTGGVQQCTSMKSQTKQGPIYYTATRGLTETNELTAGQGVCSSLQSNWPKATSPGLLACGGNVCLMAAWMQGAGVVGLCWAAVHGGCIGEHFHFPIEIEGVV